MDKKKNENFFLNNICIQSIVGIICFPYINFLPPKISANANEPYSSQQNSILNMVDYRMRFQNSLSHIYHVSFMPCFDLLFISFCFPHVSIFYISNLKSSFSKKLFTVLKYVSHSSRSFINFLTVHSHTIRHLIPLLCNSILTT